VTATPGHQNRNLNSPFQMEINILLLSIFCQMDLAVINIFLSSSASTSSLSHLSFSVVSIEETRGAGEWYSLVKLL
jgi:hypothetical protein